MSDAIPQSPPRHDRINFWMLMFGACAAPIFWLGQLILGYGVSAIVCYGGDHPTAVRSGAALRVALIAFDAIAITFATLALLISYLCWRGARDARSQTTDISDGRAKFMAIWGIWSSACFLLAILFSTITSVTVPLCVR